MTASERVFFEPRFGRDFSQVRLHTSNDASHAAQAIGARAFTVGNDIVMRADQYAPFSDAGRRLLAHELTHVAQQRRIDRVVRRAPSFEDCSSAQKKIIRTAVTTGTGWVTKALKELRSALGGSMSAHTRTLLTRDFHTHSASNIRKIITGFDKILSALKGSITYECESCCSGDKCGYVYAFWTDVHFCPSFFSAASTPTFQARCLTHELAHKEAGACCDTYEYDSGYSGLTPSKAIKNADSYAVFARDI